MSIVHYGKFHFLVFMIERILNLMKQSSVTAKQLTSDLEISSTSITDWKKGKGRPSADAIVKLAKYFGVTTDYILTGKEEDSSSISMEDEELLGYYHSLSKTDQRWIMGQMIDLIKKYDSQAEKRQVSGK